MSALVSTQRYNWMGYHGAETEEIDLSLMRAGDARPNNLDYERRQEVIADVKERLYLIKKDLDLIPEEELRAEEERVLQRREQRKRREEEARRAAAEAAIEAQRKRETQEAARREEEERQRAEGEAARARNAGDSDVDSEDTEEREACLAKEESDRSELLSVMPRTQEEIDNSVETFSKGVRQLLSSQGAAYVSYLDGSEHTTIDKLDAYNKKHRSEVAEIVKGSNVTLPAESSFAVDRLRRTLEARNTARKELDALRCKNDPTYAARVRASEKEAMKAAAGASSQDESTLTRRLEEAKAAALDAQKDYNSRAATCASKVAPAYYSRFTGTDSAREANEQPDEHPTEEVAERAISSKKSTPKVESEPAVERAISPKKSTPQEHPTEEPECATSSKKSTPKAESEHAVERAISPKKSTL